jgi:hypothetical protein
MGVLPECAGLIEMEEWEMNERMKFTRIKGDYSQVRRLPRLGKIRLGLKVRNQAGKEYPTETEHFVCPPEVTAVYGEEPTELEVMLPSDNPEEVFVQKYAMYGAGAGLKCHGNGEQAERYNEQTKSWGIIQCPCSNLKSDENPKGACTPQSHLMVMLPKVSMGGCYQITTRSFHATVGINSSLDLIRALAGRIALVPLKLRRVPTVTQYNGSKKTHYILNLILDASLPQIAELRQNPEHLLIPARYQIEGPVDLNPEGEPVDMVVHDPIIEAEALANMTDAEIERLKAEMDKKQPVGQDGARGHAGTIPQEPGTRDAAPPSTPPISEEDWSAAVNMIEEDPNLRVLKDLVKVNMKIKTLKLVEKGKREFIRQFRIECEKENLGAACKRIFG